ncbi:GFA family protein [Lusitaniella coriacea LEGE 07157]|uniref:GFA family protein n=1 Tax=Lusitaniella coriacea LEGE 07157 TaxID=945747 RepID=A0A8J7DVP8_9CYAN|nr:GFA family protein [Lusitaniella coriacea]MBE9115956.1 GFA family protein [Lusitaniella coriacea LEGE 07157]
MSELSVFKGRCLCGTVSLSTTHINHHIAACHCNMCRKWGGGALLGVECNEGVRFEGEENIGRYQSSEWAERGFCNKCGTHLFYKLKENNHYYIPAGIFDGDEGFIFDLQVFIEEKPEYYAFANRTKNMTGEELFALFASDSSNS